MAEKVDHALEAREFGDPEQIVRKVEGAEEPPVIKEEITDKGEGEEDVEKPEAKSEGGRKMGPK